MRVIYPGTFDPITFGHIDLIKRAAKIFDEVVVAVIQNPSKKTLFDFTERMELINGCLEEFDNVKVEGFDGLVVDFAMKMNTWVILRGLRMISDFEYEFQMALTNKSIEEKVETIFLMPRPEYSYVSSKLIKEAFCLGADISAFVPELVRGYLKKKKDESKS